MNEKRICLNRSVLDFMAAHIDRSSFVVEFGAGWSSRWFADRCGRLVSFETSPYWYRTVKDSLRGAEGEWDVIIGTDVPDDVRSGAADLVLVDCLESLRYMVTPVAWGLVREGGWLIFDDAQRPKHRKAINLLGPPDKTLVWQEEHDIPEARERVALAWQKCIS